MSGGRSVAQYGTARSITRKDRSAGVCLPCGVSASSGARGPLSISNRACSDPAAPSRTTQRTYANSHERARRGLACRKSGARPHCSAILLARERQPSAVPRTLIEGLASTIAYAVMFSVSNAVGMTFVRFMWPRYFGRRHLGSIQGTVQMIGVVGASLGPLPFGLGYELTGAYAAALLGSALLPLICAVLALFLREPALSRRGEGPSRDGLASSVFSLRCATPPAWRPAPLLGGRASSCPVRSDSGDGDVDLAVGRRTPGGLGLQLASLRRFESVDGSPPSGRAAARHSLGPQGAEDRPAEPGAVPWNRICASRAGAKADHAEAAPPVRPRRRQRRPAWSSPT